MKEETRPWLLQAEEHYQDALYLYEGSRYSLAVYSCHQALEKILKAAVVEFAAVSQTREIYLWIKEKFKTP